MSGLAVVLRRDGAPADVAALRLVLARLAHRGADGERVAASGPVAIGHRHFWTTPEEIDERQPLADPAGRFLIAVDGRVDNRDDLTSALGIAAAEAATSSDARLLLQVYERWGIAGFARVVGSFAAVVWNAAERRLVLVRDPLGDRTVCYAVTPTALVAASEEYAVLAHPGVSDALDERRLAQFLAIADLDSDATFFAAVKEVLPGHALVVDDAGMKTVRYWEASPQPVLRLRDDREYGEVFREALRAAVSAHMRSASPVALMLSGGLDSSGIAGMAATLAPPPAVLAISWVFDELPSCDERAFIDPVVAHCRLAPLQFRGDDDWPFKEFALGRHNPSSPEDDLYRRLVQRARSLGRAAGARVVLSGMFGDHLYSGADGWTWERRPGAGPASALAAAWAEAWRPHGLRRLLAAGVARLPHGVARALRQLRGTDAPWLTSRARHVLGGTHGPAAAAGALRPAQHRSVLGLITAHGVAGETFHAASDGVEVRYPYRDRRVVDLALRLPSGQLYRPGLTRPVLREALRGLVPEVARNRIGKTSLAALFQRGVVERERQTVDAALARGRPVWRWLVREDWLDRAAPGTKRAEIEELVVTQCAALARWLDTRGGAML